MRGKRKTINSNFSAGELDPKLVPMRSDVQTWQQGAKQMVNMRPMLHGGAITRPGSTFLAALAMSAILVPFEFSETQGYVLCLRDFYMDIFYDNGTYATGLTTPWSRDTSSVLRYAQAGDVIIFTHNQIQPYKLVRTGAASFTLTVYEFSLEPHGRNSPFYRYAAPDITLQTSGVTGIDINVNASAPVFNPAHGGYFFRIGGKQMMLTSYLDSQNALFAIAGEPLPGTAATTDWDVEAFNPVDGWPHAVCFHNERLVFGGSLKHPSGLWASQVGDFFNFDLADGTDDKAIWVGIAADKVVSVQHLASFKHLTVFTDQVELYQPEGDTQPWSPKTTAIRQQTGFGCHPNIKPVRFDEAVIFVQKYGRHVREFLFDAVSQTYSSDALSVMNPSRIMTPVCATGVTAWKQPVPEQYAFVVMAGGGMAVLHSLRAQRITAWSWWTTNGWYRQACAVNGNVFLMVERIIGGVQSFYLEMINFAVALDAAVGLAVTPGGTSVSGITHLNGQLAQAVNNGYAHNPVVVSGGVYSLTDDQWGGSTTIVGIPYSTVLESMPPEIQVDDGSSRGRPVRIVKAGVQVDQSVRLVVEKEGAVITNIDDDYSIPPTPLSGMYDFVLLGFDKGKTVTVRCDVPLQLTVLGLALEVVV